MRLAAPASGFYSVKALEGWRESSSGAFTRESPEDRNFTFTILLQALHDSKSKFALQK
jgi:hypothetical protein